MPSLRQVFFRLANVSRQRRPSSLRVPPLILPTFYCDVTSPSLKLLCNGSSGRSRTSSNSDLLWAIRLSARLSEGKAGLGCTQIVESLLQRLLGILCGRGLEGFQIPTEISNTAVRTCSIMRVARR